MFGLASLLIFLRVLATSMASGGAITSSIMISFPFIMSYKWLSLLTQVLVLWSGPCLNSFSCFQVLCLWFGQKSIYEKFLPSVVIVFVDSSVELVAVPICSVTSWSIGEILNFILLLIHPALWATFSASFNQLFISCSPRFPLKTGMDLRSSCCDVN